MCLIIRLIKYRINIIGILGFKRWAGCIIWSTDCSGKCYAYLIYSQGEYLHNESQETPGKTKAVCV